MERFWEIVKSHPFMIAGAVLFVIILMYFYSSSGSSSSAPTSVTGSPDAATVAAQAQVQANANQVNGAVTAATIAANAQTAQYQIAANVANAQTAAVQDVMNQQTLGATNIANIQAGMATTLANISAQTAANNNQTSITLAGVQGSNAVALANANWAGSNIANTTAIQGALASQQLSNANAATQTWYGLLGQSMYVPGYDLAAINSPANLGVPGLNVTGSGAGLSTYPYGNAGSPGVSGSGISTLPTLHFTSAGTLA